MKAGNGDVRRRPATCAMTPTAAPRARPRALAPEQRLAPFPAPRYQPQKYNDIVAKIMKDLDAWTPEAEQQLCYEIKTFLLAGHETSAAMLTWSMYELSQHPEMLARVRAEAEEALPVTAAAARDAPEKAAQALPERPAVEGMRYTLGVLKEALRRYSVVPVVTRMTAVRCVVDFHWPP